VQELGAIDGAELTAGDRLVMETPGGGSWGINNQGEPE
jgi:N-methylhydantoinase B/oxoprolinase/acetone carboxylase alpha subunit